jgi:dTDP-4-dehydrorhamnose 3,5-epimerase-like enzyme
LKFELSSESEDQLYIPAGFAHGSQRLCDDVLVNYLISVPYAPQSACGIRYDDGTSVAGFSAASGDRRSDHQRDHAYHSQGRYQSSSMVD